MKHHDHFPNNLILLIGTHSPKGLPIINHITGLNPVCLLDVIPFLYPYNHLIPSLIHHAYIISYRLLELLLEAIRIRL